MAKLNFDIAIIGAGPVGLSLAAALASLGLEIALIEKDDLNKRAKKKKAHESSRLYAISMSSYDMLSQYGFLKNVKEFGEPIRKIEITGNDQGPHILFDPKDVHKEQFGYMIEEPDLLADLYERVIKIPNVTIYDKTKWEEIDNGDFAANVVLSDNKTIRSSILIAADGKASKVRRAVGIDVFAKPYNQTALICNINHEKHHNGLALERFYKNGPFAVLPKFGGYSSGIVWSDGNEIASAMNCPGFSVEEMICEKVGEHLGQIKVSSQPKFFPLELIHARKYFENRVLLVGDSSHSIHPVAGQGVNLGFKDVEVLVDIIKSAVSLGMDLKDVAQEYSNIRRTGVTVMIESTDFISSIFSFKILRSFTNLGLVALNYSGAIKKRIMQYAMGYE